MLSLIPQTSYTPSAMSNTALKSSKLMDLVQSYEWARALSRVLTHPSEASERGPHGRAPLHFACDHDAPSQVVKALLAAYPEALDTVGTSDMNPLHITCSSPNASVDVVNVLLNANPKSIQTSMRDVDGDTPLHAACRCGAPSEVLEVLLKANPGVVLQRDYEGLTPLLRLWVRYFVMLGDDIIDSVQGPEDLVGPLGEAWNKTELLLRVARYGSVDIPEGAKFRAIHAAAAVDCPRAVLKIATSLYPEQLMELDENGETPLIIAAKTPIYKVHDLSADGFSYEEGAYNYAERSHNYQDEDEIQYGEEEETSTPSVIDVLLQACPDLVRIPDERGRLPLNVAIQNQKCWNQGVKKLFHANPIPLHVPDQRTRLYPFMLAAVEENSNLNTVFELLRKDPELVRCDGSPNKKYTEGKRAFSDDCEQTQSKKRRTA